MSKKVSSTAIGAFVVGAMLLAVVALSLFGGGWLFGESEQKFRAVVIFTGSVKGLNVGAPVTLRGVQVGEVRSIDVARNRGSREFVIPVVMELSSEDAGYAGDESIDDHLNRLVASGLRAQLKTQSLLTGLLYVELDFLPAEKAHYVDFETDVPQIPTAPTELEAILQRVSSIDVQAFVQRADDTLKSLNSLLADPETQRIPTNVNATLADVRALVVRLDGEVVALDARLDRLTGSSDATLVAVREEVRHLGARLDTSLGVVDGALSSVHATSSQIDYALSEQSPLMVELRSAVQDLGRASRSLQALADGIEREPESLLRGRSGEGQ